MPFEDPELLDPVIHCFARCYSCRHLIRIETDDKDELDLSERKCPHCGVFIEEHQIHDTFAYEFWHTASITSANKLQNLDLAVIPYIAVGLLMLATGFPIWFRILVLLPYFIPLTIIVRWLYKYWYTIRFTDNEYLEAATAIRKSLYLWSAATALNWILLLYSPTFLLYR